MTNMFYKKAWAIFLNNVLWTWRDTRREAEATIKSMERSGPTSYRLATWTIKRIEIRELPKARGPKVLHGRSRVAGKAGTKATSRKTLDG
jgi:hypothetical protein